MFGWVRKLFTPPQAPRPAPEQTTYSSIKVTQVVTLNGKTLEGEDADRVSKIMDEMHGNLDESWESMHRTFERLREEAKRHESAKTK